MKPWIFGKWHAWQGNNAILLSDEDNKQLSSFPDIDTAINWLYWSGNSRAARALNHHKQADT
jgi:hypothetical protein